MLKRISLKSLTNPIYLKSPYLNASLINYRSFGYIAKTLENIDERSYITYGLKDILDGQNPHEIKQIVKNIENDLPKYNDYSKSKYDHYLKGFYDFVKSNIIQTNEESLKAMSQHYLRKEGKLVRPLTNFLLANLLYELNKTTIQEGESSKGITFQDSKEFLMQKIWAGVIELLHISSLMHDDVIDNAKTRRNMKAVNEEYGVKNACFAANFIVGRCVQKIHEFQDLLLYQIYGKIMDDLTSGEYIQARKNKNLEDLDQILKDYMIKTYYKTGSLISNSLRGVALILKEDMPTQTSCFRFGQHLGIAFQLIDDILDYTKSSDKLGKPALSDLKEGVITGPVYFCLHELKTTNKSDYQHLMKLISKPEEITNHGLEEVSRMIKFTSGIEKTKELAFLHINEGIQCLYELAKTKSNAIDIERIQSFQQLKELIYFVILREN